MTFWSRSRQELWTKGETSGNRLRLVRIHYNCEDNTLLVKASPRGRRGAATPGNRTCYFRELEQTDTMSIAYDASFAHELVVAADIGGQFQHAYTRAAS